MQGNQKWLETMKDPSDREETIFFHVCIVNCRERQQRNGFEQFPNDPYHYRAKIHFG